MEDTVWKKFVVIGGIAAAVGLGIGGVALASSPSSAPAANSAGAAVVAAPAALTTAPTSASKSLKAGDGKRREALVKRLEKVAHAQWVTKDGKTGKFVTHDAIRGTVTALTTHSITVKSADGTSETFVVTSATKVHLKGAAKGTKGTIGQVKVGDQAGVVGTGTSVKTATAVIDRGAAGSKTKATTTSAPTTS